MREKWKSLNQFAQRQNDDLKFRTEVGNLRPAEPLQIVVTVWPV